MKTIVSAIAVTFLLQSAVVSQTNDEDYANVGCENQWGETICDCGYLKYVNVFHMPILLAKSFPLIFSTIFS